MEAIIGTCKHCKKAEIMAVSGGMSQADADRLMSERCDCPQARFERAQDDIAAQVCDQLGEEAVKYGFSPQNSEICELAIRIAGDIVLGRLRYAKFTLGCKDSLIIKASGDGVSVTRAVKSAKK